MRGPPWPASARFAAEPMQGFNAPPGGQMARIGTDILSQRVIAFHYEANPPFAVVGPGSCHPGDGMRAAGVAGAFGGDPRQHNRELPNVPAITLAIGPLKVPAQIDTGFADLAPGIVQANRRLIDALRDAGVAMTQAPPGATRGCSDAKPNER